MTISYVVSTMPTLGTARSPLRPLALGRNSSCSRTTWRAARLPCSTMTLLPGTHTRASAAQLASVLSGTTTRLGRAARYSASSARM